MLRGAAFVALLRLLQAFQFWNSEKEELEEKPNMFRKDLLSFIIYKTDSQVLCI